MRLLDLFCGAGGAAMGYHRAGFTEIVGVDIKPQPHYPFTFVQDDALDYLEGLIFDRATTRFDAIHASPPCQAYTTMRHVGKARLVERVRYPELIEVTRDLCRRAGLPYVIENVVGSPLDRFNLCGSFFGLGVRRHRLFESNVLLLGQRCRHDPSAWPVAGWARREHRGPIAVYGDHPEDSAIHRRGKDKPGLTRRAATLAVAQRAMGIDWMTWPELTQAIPPAYTEYIGRQLLEYLR